MNEQRVIVCILQHTMHRINEFFDEKTPTDQSFTGLTPEQVSTEFARWLSRKDSCL